MAHVKYEERRLINFTSFCTFLIYICMAPGKSYISCTFSTCVCNVKECTTVFLEYVGYNSIHFVKILTLNLWLDWICRCTSITHYNVPSKILYYGTQGIICVMLLCIEWNICLFTWLYKYDMLYTYRRRQTVILHATQKGGMNGFLVGTPTCTNGRGWSIKSIYFTCHSQITRRAIV